MRIESQQQPSQYIQGTSSGSRSVVKLSENVTTSHLGKAVNTPETFLLQAELPKEIKVFSRVILKERLGEVESSLKPSGDNDPRYFSKENKVINRFDNIPSRVETRVGKALHANNITIDNKEVAIAAQYPLKEQMQNFLKMIVQQKISVIVVLASKNEINNQSNEMCNYFHHSGEYGEITTNSKKTETYELVDKTKVDTYDLLIQSQDNNFPVKVHHVTNWPDHGTLSAEATSQFVDSIKNAQEENEGVPVIHCRAGVGRTGVILCGLAMKEDVSVEKAIVEARECRNGYIVQNDEQMDCLIKMAAAKGWPVLKEEEPGGKMQLRTSGLLNTIQSAEEKSESAVPSKVVDPASTASPLLRKKNIENGQAIIDARGVRNAGTFENIFGKIIKSKINSDGKYKKSAIVVDLLPLQQSGDLMKSILDNRTPVIVILGGYKENSSIEGVNNFFTGEKDYDNGLKIVSKEVENKKLSKNINVNIYSMSLSDEYTRIKIPVIHAYDLSGNFLQDDQLINILAEEIEYHSAERVDRYKSKGSSAIGDPNKLLPVFVCPQESNEVQGLIDAVIKSNKR